MKTHSLLLVFSILCVNLEAKAVVQKLTKKKSPHRKLDFFITTTWSAEQKKEEQDLRFRELMRKAISSRQNEYTFERHLDTEEQTTMTEVNGIYENVKANILKSKDTLLQMIDQIFNNEIYQNKWFYR